VHEHGASSTASLEAVVAVVALVVIAVYLGAVIRNRRRRPWPASRSVLWVAGVVTAAVAVAGPLADAGHDSFPAHMLGHLLLGMLAPLLLVLAAPVTLALRSLHPVPARRLSALLRTPVARFFVHPVPAATLNVVGLWMLYATEFYSVMHANPFVAMLVQVHVFVAGYLFTASMISVDPMPHRPGHAFRAIVLVLALAGHAVLAKHLYGHPPAGVPAGEAEPGSLLMYYGGDVVEGALFVVLCAQWYRRTAPRKPAAGAATLITQGDHNDAFRY
jgi:putative membrane protein